MKRIVWAAGFLLLPALASAAGFAKQSIFLSQGSVTEGQTVRIYAVVSNDATTTFVGTMVFKDAGSTIGTLAVSLAPQEAQTASISWRPAAGAHTVNVDIKNKADALLEEQSAVFSIKAKPPTPPKAMKGAQASATDQSASAVESSAGIQSQLGSLSSAAEQTTAPVFKLVDGARESVAQVLDGQLASIKPKITPIPLPSRGEVQGAETVKAPDQGSWFSSIFYTVYYYVLTALRFLVGSAAVFYPVFVLLVAFILYRTYKRFRRP